jgi:hypothetical protein
MQIPCPKCGTLNWLENEKTCRMCTAVLRRCADCSNLDRNRMTCRIHDFDMTMRQAEEPSMLSTSTSCTEFSYNKTLVA